MYIINTILNTPFLSHIFELQVYASNLRVRAANMVSTIADVDVMSGVNNTTMFVWRIWVFTRAGLFINVFIRICL